MKRILLLSICLLTFTFGFSQTETITIPWDFFSVPPSDPNFPSGAMFDTNIVIEVGDTVVWDWLSGGHNVKSDGESVESFGTPGGDFDTFPTGYTYAYTFTILGTSNFICAPHETLMYGSVSVVPEGTLSVSSSNISSFSISPNPARNSFTLDLGALNNNVLVEIYDVLGKKVLNRKINATTSTFNISSWNSGLYIIKISSEKTVLMKRFVKQ
ncbi:MAG: hypothetical protein ACJAZK_000372 [Psychroserpens sp.]|jgi:hypothetical protein|uniref:T9SS type A sorting domain-containing protein n=1 Tax=Psychroserpens sp. TaxID=2020870 RepID=UPI0039E542C6